MRRWNYKRYRKLIAAVATSVTGLATLLGFVLGTNLDALGVALGGTISTVGNAWAVFWFPNAEPA